MEGTVTINLKDFEMLKATSDELARITRIMEEAYNDGEPVMTDELKRYIEEIYS